MVNENIPNIVKLFLYPMFGVIKNKNINFLTPKKVSELKEDLSSMTNDCEAIVWILKHKNVDYSNWVAKCYDSGNVVDFTASNAVVFLHENIFELSGVEFDQSLLPENIDRDEILKFYVDYPPEVNLIRYLYSNFKDLNSLESEISDRFKSKASSMLEVIKSISHFDSVDYAIALQDYNNPESAENFIKILKQALINIISKNSH